MIKPKKLLKVVSTHNSIFIIYWHTQTSVSYKWYLSCPLTPQSTSGRCPPQHSPFISFSCACLHTRTTQQMCSLHRNCAIATSLGRAKSGMTELPAALHPFLKYLYFQVTAYFFKFFLFWNSFRFTEQFQRQRRKFFPGSPPMLTSTSLKLIEIRAFFTAVGISVPVECG